MRDRVLGMGWWRRGETRDSRTKKRDSRRETGDRMGWWVGGWRLVGGVHRRRSSRRIGGQNPCCASCFASVYIESVRYMKALERVTFHF